MIHFFIIESAPLFSCLWCNRTWYHHFSQDTFPLFISSNKVLCVRWLQQRFPKCIWRSWGQHGYSSAPFPAEDVMIKVCVPHNLQHPQAPLPITLCGAKLIIVQTNYMTWWEEYNCRSVPVVCQINKCLMTLSLPLFNLIRGWTDLLDGWLYSKQPWIWSRGTANPVIRRVYWFVPQLRDCCLSHLTIADHRRAQLCDCSHLSILLQHVSEKDHQVTDSKGCWIVLLI